MAMELRSFGELAKVFSAIGRRGIELEGRNTLTRVGRLVRNHVQAKFGHYQPSVGPYPAWQQLASFTQQDRVARGKSPNDPLLVDGTLKESIHFHVEHGELTVGSTEDKALWLEVGTHSNPRGAPIPPRPFLGPTALELTPEILHLIGRGVTAVIGHTTEAEADRFGI